MRPGTEVRPHKWSNVIDLFDNGWYSAIWGSYEESNERCLGVRWNGDNADDPNGYPKQGVFPLWYVEPHILHRPILLALQQELVNSPSLRRTPEYQRNIIIALGECE